MISMMPCPFCGRLPAWQAQSVEASAVRQLACNNPDCKMDVRTRRAGTDQELIADWNSRVHPSPADDWDDGIRAHLRKILGQLHGGRAAPHSGIIASKERRD
jgi:Restriction alleviation protein Lar